MTIPANLTHVEAGVFLQAVAERMVVEDVCFDAALDGCSDEVIERRICGLLTYVIDVPAEVDWVQAARDRAAELMQLTGQEAVEFVTLKGTAP